MLSHREIGINKQKTVRIRIKGEQAEYDQTKDFVSVEKSAQKLLEVTFVVSKVEM